MADEGDVVPFDEEGSGRVCKVVKKPEYIAWRTFRDGKLEEASYVVNNESGGLQIFKPIGKKTVNYSSFFEKIGGSDPDPSGKTKRIEKLSDLEKDLIGLSEKDFKKKYPNVDLIETLIKTRNVGGRIIEETD